MSFHFRGVRRIGRSKAFSCNRGGEAPTTAMVTAVIRTVTSQGQVRTCLLETSDAKSLLQKECAMNHIVKLFHTAKTQSTGDRDKGASRFAAALRAR